MNISIVDGRYDFVPVMRTGVGWGVMGRAARVEGRRAYGGIWDMMWEFDGILLAES